MKMKIILVWTLLLNVSATAMTSKVKAGDNKIVYEVLEGDSKIFEKKPGLAVDLTYKTQHVEVGEESDVHINITTDLIAGTLKIKMNALDNTLSGVDEEIKEFKISETSNHFSIDLTLSSAVDGRHYLNLHLSVEDKGSRVFVVPIYVGTLHDKVDNKVVQKTNNGTMISVSSAEEEIK